MSIHSQLFILHRSHQKITFMISIKDILICISQRKFIRNNRLSPVPILRSLGGVRGKSFQKLLLRLWAPSQYYYVLLWQLLPTCNAVQHGRPHAFLLLGFALWPSITAPICRYWASEVGLPTHGYVMELPDSFLRLQKWQVSLLKGRRDGTRLVFIRLWQGLGARHGCTR